MTETNKTWTRTLLTPALLTSFLLLPLLAAGCQQGEPEDPNAADETPAAEAPTGTGEAAEAGEDVTYEPAYPTDVSDEGLTEEDTEQQMGHGHEGEHTHEDGNHEHEGDHAHDGEHDHEQGGHDHGDGEHDEPEH